MTRMVVGLVLLACAGGCPRTPTDASPPVVAEPVTAQAEPSGIYGRIDAEAGVKMRVFRAGVREPVATVSLDEPLARPLPEGVYVAVLEDGTRRVFGISGGPVTLADGIFDPWPGEDSTVAALEAVHRRWFQWLIDREQDREALRSRGRSRDSVALRPRGGPPDRPHRR